MRQVHGYSGPICDASGRGHTREHTRKWGGGKIPERTVELVARIAPDVPGWVIDRILDGAAVSLSRESPWSLCDEPFMRSWFNLRRLTVDVQRDAALPFRRAEQTLHTPELIVGTND